MKFLPPLTSPDGRLPLRLVVINSTPPANGGNVNMWPTFPTTGTVNCATRNPIDCGQRSPGQIRLADEPYGVVSQFRGAQLLSKMMGSVPLFVSVVFCWGRPSQIISPVIAGVSIAVRRLVSFSRWRAVKNKCHDTVKPMLSVNAATQDADILIAIGTGVRFSRPRPPFWGFAHIGTEPAHGADRVSVSKGYRLPNFCAKIFGIHGAVLSRGGQGRALLKQRFRPAFYSRNLANPQRIVL